MAVVVYGDRESRLSGADESWLRRWRVDWCVRWVCLCVGDGGREFGDVLWPSARACGVVRLFERAWSAWHGLIMKSA